MAGISDFRQGGGAPPVISPARTNVPPPKRHGCLLTWLLLMVVGDTLEILFKVLGPVFDGALGSLSKAASTSSAGSHLAMTAATVTTPPIPAWFLVVTIILCGLDVVAVVGVFCWKRWGFYLSVAASGILFAMNLVNGTGVVNSLIYLVSPCCCISHCGWAEKIADGGG
jgi:hypothetical protein